MFFVHVWQVYRYHLQLYPMCRVCIGTHDQFPLFSDCWAGERIYFTTVSSLSGIFYKVAMLEGQHFRIRSRPHIRRLLSPLLNCVFLTTVMLLAGVTLAPAATHHPLVHPWERLLFLCRAVLMLGLTLQRQRIRRQRTRRIDSVLCRLLIVNFDFCFYVFL